MLGKSLVVAGALLTLAGVAYAAEPYGVFERPSTGSHVRFYNCGGKLCGKVIAVKEPSRKGEIGKFVMRGGVKNGNSWKGTLVDVGSGKTYSGTITAESASALSVQGCLMSMLCQTESWPRVK